MICNSTYFQKLRMLTFFAVRKGSENGELPFVIDLPQKYEDLEKLLDAQSDANCEVIIKRLIKLYHPSLREGNKSRLGRLFIFLLRYFNYHFSIFLRYKTAIVK